MENIDLSVRVPEACVIINCGCSVPVKEKYGLYIRHVLKEIDTFLPKSARKSISAEIVAILDRMVLLSESLTEDNPFINLNGEGKMVEFPTETTYFYETNVRRYIRMTPNYFNGEVKEYKILCVHINNQKKIEKFNVPTYELKTFTFISKDERELLKSFANNEFDIIKKDKFENSLENAIYMLKK